LFNPYLRLLLQICVNPDSEDPHALFGCQPEKAPALLQLAAELGLRCCGVSFTVGVDSAHRRPQAMYAQAIEWAVQLFGIGAAIGHQMRVLNIGNVWSEAEHFPEATYFLNHRNFTDLLQASKSFSC
jgi:ornithine decarboxylase